MKEHSISAVVCDFSPLRVPLGWVNDVAHEIDKLGVPLIQVRIRTSNVLVLYLACRLKFSNSKPFAVQIPYSWKYWGPKQRNYETVLVDSNLVVQYDITIRTCTRWKYCQIFNLVIERHTVKLPNLIPCQISGYRAIQSSRIDTSHLHTVIMANILRAQLNISSDYSILHVCTCCVCIYHNTTVCLMALLLIGF